MNQGVGDSFAPGMDGVAITEEGAYDGNATVTGLALWEELVSANPEMTEAEEAVPEVMQQTAEARDNFNTYAEDMQTAEDSKYADAGEMAIKGTSALYGAGKTAAPVAKAATNAFSHGLNPLAKKAFQAGRNILGKGLSFGARRAGGMAMGGAVGGPPGAAIGWMAPDAVPALMKQGVGALDRYNNEKNGNPLHTLQRRHPDDHPGKLLTRAMHGEHNQAPDLTKHSFR